MARPSKPIQRRANGTFFVRLNAGGKRLTKSLETTNPVVAAKRAHQALEELQAQIDGPQQQKWRADEPGVEWTIPAKPDGSPDWDNAVPKAIVAADVLEPEQLRQLDWRDLVNEAVKVRRRKTGKDYSDSWYENLRIAIDKCPFTLQEATPKNIRKWMQQMQQAGSSGRTVEINVGCLASLIKVSIKSGLLDGWSNAFDSVDYTSNTSTPIYTACEADYRGLKALLPTLPRDQRIPLTMQIFLGTRISELKRRKPGDFDLDAGTMTVAAGTAKNKMSERVIPLPEAIVKELRKGLPTWPVTETINKKTKQINPKLTTHSFRHGLIRLGRDLKLDPDPIEAAVGHALGGMKDTYGDGFSVDVLRSALTPIWEQLDAWIFDCD